MENAHETLLSLAGEASTDNETIISTEHSLELLDSSPIVANSMESLLEDKVTSVVNSSENTATLNSETTSDSVELSLGENLLELKGTEEETGCVEDNEAKGVQLLTTEELAKIVEPVVEESVQNVENGEKEMEMRSLSAATTVTYVESNNSDVAMNNSDIGMDEGQETIEEFLKVAETKPEETTIAITIPETTIPTTTSSISSLTEFEDAREKIIEDLMAEGGGATEEDKVEDEILPYSPQFVDVAESETNNTTTTTSEETTSDTKTSEDSTTTTTTRKLDSIDSNMEEISMDIEEPITVAAATNNTKQETNNKEKQQLQLEEEENLVVEKVVEDKLELLLEGGASVTATNNTITLSTSTRDEIDTLLSTLMPDLENHGEKSANTSESSTIQYLEDVLAKPTNKRKLLEETSNNGHKKAKIDAKIFSFDDLLSNLTKIRMPSNQWKVRITAGENPFSEVEFHEKADLLRSVKFFKDGFKYRVCFGNCPVTLLGAPKVVEALEDVTILLNIVNNLIKNDPVVNYQ